mgnify:CR=1 FL=1
MIISASRRTDIPAFYSEWFLNRIKAGFVDVVNPFNTKQVSRISLNPKVVDCIVFWTKDAAPIIDRLNALKAYKFYFQFTITPYDEDVEPGLLRHQTKDDIVRTFQRLSDKIGQDKVIWRYDPILLSRNHSVDWHFDQFAYLCDKLAPYTKRCVISFLDLYSKTKHNTQPLGIRDISVDEMRELALGISQIADGKLEVQSCSEKIDLAEFGIKHGACIDKEIIEQVIGAEIDIAKDKTQRQECGCMSSVDIGQYDTCTHLCAYCYANFRPQIAKANFDRHNPKATSLYGELNKDAKITERKMTTLKILRQQSLF